MTEPAVHEDEFLVQLADEWSAVGSPGVAEPAHQPLVDRLGGDAAGGERPLHPPQPAEEPPLAFAGDAAMGRCRAVADERPPRLRRQHAEPFLVDLQPQAGQELGDGGHQVAELAGGRRHRR